MARRDEVEEEAIRWKKWRSSDHKIRCYGKGKDMGLINFAELVEPTIFHDEELAKLTQTLNNEIKKVKENNKDPTRRLAVLDTPKGPFISWVHYGDIGADDDPDTIKKVLGLKG